MIDFLLALHPNPIAHHRFQFLPMVAPREGSCKAGIVGQLGAIHDVAQARPGFGGNATLDSDCNPAVFGFEQHATPPSGVAVDPARLDAAVDLTGGCGLLDRDVDELAGTGNVALPNGCHERAKGRTTSIVEYGIAANLQRLPFRQSYRIEQASDGRGYDLVNQIIAIRPILSEGRYGGHDQSRIER